MRKRVTLFIDEDNWKKYETLKIEKLTKGQGDLSFTSYVNIVLRDNNFSLEQIKDKLKKKKGLT